MKHYLLDRFSIRLLIIPVCMEQNTFFMENGLFYVLSFLD